MMMKKYLYRIFLAVAALCAAIPAQAQGRIYYVTPTGLTADGTRGDGTAWNNPTTLTAALDLSVAGDRIYVQGFEDTSSATTRYVTPTTDGFRLKSGVRLYGGFAGTEQTPEQRATTGEAVYQMRYRTLITGDIAGDDVADRETLLFPQNPTRADNATHVLTLNMNPASGVNNNNYPTVVDGVSIVGGHAVGGHGGGIYVAGDNSRGGVYRIVRCFVAGNYADEGGGIYVDANAGNVGNDESLIDRCYVFNNVAGDRTESANYGGGIRIAGAGTIVNTIVSNNESGGLLLSGNAKSLNNTITRNTGSGIDGTGAAVYNTVIWGNALLTTSEATRPDFRNSAFPESDGTNGNVPVSAKNNDRTSPSSFETPSVRTGFDRDFEPRVDPYPMWIWYPLEGSILIDKGDSGFFETALYGNTDIDNATRVRGTIDIGAYEHQPVQAGRIRYVRAGATGNGTSWDDASGDLQRMIDALADNNPQGLAGEVWVAAGTYTPQSQIISGTTYSASFRMRDGISVYGGFAGGEASKDERRKSSDKPWEFEEKTELLGTYFGNNTEWSNNRWTLTSDSRHVVWFAPMQGEAAFRHLTVLDGVTIRGGYAQGGLGVDEFATDKGAGVYMDGANAYLNNCIVTENYSTGNGGGVYLRHGRVQGTLVYNNSADGNGGGVYADNVGLVIRSMVANNSAGNGAGVYLSHTGPWTDGEDHPEYLVLSTSIVTNNTARQNGAVYCADGGVLLQNIIANNELVTATDLTDENAAQTGGIYVNGYATVINSVIWNNRDLGASVPIYAKNPSTSTVRFMNNAISNVNSAVWNNILQQSTLSLTGSNVAADGEMSPDFSVSGQMADNAALEGNTGVQSGWLTTGIDYYWEPITGSNLRAMGMTLGMMPDDVILQPEIDINGNLYAQKPAIGAYRIEQTVIRHETTADALIVYVDPACTEPSHDGSSWEKAYRAISEAIDYLAGLDAATVGGRHLEVRALEGEYTPKYVFVNEDPKTATLSIPATASGATLHIIGGYGEDYVSGEIVRNPTVYRSVVDGNADGVALTDGLYHCIMVEGGAHVVIDGFHVVGGYAAGEAAVQYGAGALVLNGADATFRNCIFENNTAATGAAIDARDAAALSLVNCVVNNNTATAADGQIVNCPADRLTMQHTTIVNNAGTAPANMGTSSFAAGNTGGNSVELTVDSSNFANPTNTVGATLGFDTYLGGYSEFRPLTSSIVVSNNIINKATGASADVTTDITTENDRDLGGIPDLGAYEALLPKAGAVIYVRSYNTETGDLRQSDGSPDMSLLENNPGKSFDGSSWDNAINGNAICDLTVERAGNNFYVIDWDNTLQAASYDNYNYRSGNYGPEAGSYGEFFGGNSGNNTYNSYNQITNNRNESYVSGLQYAIEKASKYNKAHPDDEPIVVWVGAGIYTDYKGFVIRDGVKVYGAFPSTGNPGENDRKALLSTYIPAREEDQNLNKADYETILQVRKETPVTWNGNTATAASWVNRLSGTQRHYVLYQPDVCLPTWAPNNDNKNSRTGGNQYRYEQGTTYYDGTYYVEYEGALWDGFTVRHGYIKNYEANRDGGAGIRTFRGVTLENMVVVDNYNSGNRSRGGGLYMDGLNSQISNSFLLNNYVARTTQKNEAYGGGGYMIVGTGFNMVVANNQSDSDGGGLFIESATFYNNTVAYNRAANRGSGILQYADAGSGRLSNLSLYNCIFYGNVGGTNVIGSTSVGTFTPAYHCYVDGTIQDELMSKFSTNAPYNNQRSSVNPFEAGTAAGTTNNYRLAPSSTCVNKGTDNLNQGKDEGDAEAYLPETDMDFSDRIKDCTVDIGAYERNNEDFVEPDINGVYYVTFAGAGNATANSPENAACAMKLQEVLDAAGRRVAQQGLSATVKIAGYEDDYVAYHVNTLSDPNDPQSYTFVIPYGVTVMGGYDETAGNWDDDARDATTHKTVLSAVKEATATVQEVTGYHTLTFGEPLDSQVGLTTTVDGLYIEDGAATSMTAGGDDARGGGAIVPAWGHVRNCVVRNCSAVEGGGLYVMPGGLVSGSYVVTNTAETGAGIYVDNTGASAATRAHLMSNTIADNVASEQGGGIYFTEGSMAAVNTVVWGNTAPSDKNVSGATYAMFADDFLTSASGGTIAEFYPFNNCFVETYELPGNFENTEMTGDESVYFSGFYALKPYSPLVKHGTVVEVQRYFEQHAGVAVCDMVGTPRISVSAEETKIDAGADAFDGGIIPVPDNSDGVIQRIFVSQGSNVLLADGENPDDYMGRSFYTSVSWIEDALDYIEAVREKFGDDVEFELLVAGGVYKPKYWITQEEGTQGPPDQRRNTFRIPQGVAIYGGFRGDETYSTGLGSIPAASGTMTLQPDGAINTLLDSRELSDMNGNGLLEPWEMSSQTIFSGNVNASGEERRTFHVIYSEGTGEVTLDGVTVMSGQTANEMTEVTTGGDAGRGGGIYTDGVSYTISNCRFMDNFAVRGGAIYSRDGRLTISASIFAGNGTVDNPVTPSEYQPASGGAVYLTGMSETAATAALYAANTLWVNNETAGRGGAIGTNYAEGVTTTYAPMISLINNTFACNKAAMNAVIYGSNTRSEIINTLMWGNESETEEDATSFVRMNLSHSASDDARNISQSQYGTGNIQISAENMAVDGPRFTRPASRAGVAGNDAMNLWNPVSISVLTDGGDGLLRADTRKEEGAYVGWFEADLQPLKDNYIVGNYDRYSGPLREDGTEDDKPIDIGFYEYQYVDLLSTRDVVYVATEESGLADGSSWSNAISDLRSAIIALSNPTGGQLRDKRIYVRDGNYSWQRLSGGTAYLLEAVDSKNLLDNLYIYGSCTGVGDNQDFSTPTVVENSAYADGVTNTLLSIDARTKNVVISGFAFNNKDSRTVGDQEGVTVLTSPGGKVTLKNTAYRGNKSGVSISGSGETLIVNSLFADGANGIVGANANTTIVNSTFAQNSSADVTGSDFGIYNSASWKNGSYGFAGGVNGNVVINGSVENDDLAEGPNFFDPDNDDIYLRDYRIRPALKLLNNGVNDLYAVHALGLASGTAIPAEEVDLSNSFRVVDDNIDVGAYEYAAPMLPVVYVKSDLTGTADGTSWATALSDIQGAADLAAVYANQHPGSNGYVFVHSNVATAERLRINLPNVKIYGSMNDETSSYTTDDAELLVDDLLKQRRGVIESAAQSRLENGAYIDGENIVVDGFEVEGSVTLNKGYLSTSILTGTGVSGTADGVLYNAFASCAVAGVTAVNVTSTNALPDNALNSRSWVADAGKNRYTPDGYWAYQLMETSTDIDAGTADVQAYMDAVGHNRDIAGNLRVRNGVDNGCFETWNVSADGVVANADDYPHGQSVVYVREGKELGLGMDGDAPFYGESAPFNPGFLLLEHRAGLRGNGNSANLQNVAMERRVAAGGHDMASVAFSIGEVENPAALAFYTYSGEKRAGYDYKYTEDDNAWIATEATALGAGEGFLIENATDAESKVRFYNATAYEETPSVKPVALVKYNYNEEWTTDANGNTVPSTSRKFTHKENMSWNLFGSPFLCAMNYDDMPYGRVIYGLEDDVYRTVNTSVATGGYIPSGDAVFTQTATLKTEEVIEIAQPAGTVDGDAYQLTSYLTVALTADGADTESDRVTLNAVASAEASTDYDVNADGVKWTVGERAQIYAVRDGGRYSLLSAVDEEGVVGLGVEVPETGVYKISLPDDMGAADYDVVVLRDREQGKTVDLKTESYTFTVAEAGAVDNRFEVEFRMSDTLGAGFNAWSPSRGVLQIDGTDAGSVVSVFAPNGMRIRSLLSEGMSLKLSVPQGAYVVSVEKDGEIETDKAIVL